LDERGRIIPSNTSVGLLKDVFKLVMSGVSKKAQSSKRKTQNYNSKLKT